MIARAIPEFSIHSYLYAIDTKTPILKDDLLYFDSGSNAIEFFLLLFKSGKKVGVQSFTCITVVNAIKKANHTPVFLKTDSEYFTSRYDEVKRIIKNIDILILTHVAGIPNPDYVQIKELCRLSNVVLLDDICQTYHSKIGAFLLEELSDNFVYSFFYDKPICSGKGGALSITAHYKDEAYLKYNSLKKETDIEGRKILRRLYWVSKLFSPKYYEYNINRDGIWEVFILNYYPKIFSTRVLKYLLHPKISFFLNSLIKRKKQNEIKRMSDVEIKYIQSRFLDFSNNNEKLKSILLSKKQELPHYLLDSSITCSIAKRAIVSKDICNQVDVNIELDLYNWPSFVCENYDKDSAKIISDNVNIPTSILW